MVKHAFRGAAAFAATVSITATLAVQPAASQTGWANSKRDDAPMCMVRAGKDGSNLFIILPRSNARAMAAKGFAPLDCSKALASREEALRWRDNICTIAATSGKPVLDAIERQMGERPEVLCGMAEQAIGQWEQDDRMGDQAVRGGAR